MPAHPRFSRYFTGANHHKHPHYPRGACSPGGVWLTSFNANIHSLRQGPGRRARSDHPQKLLGLSHDYENFGDCLFSPIKASLNSITSNKMEHKRTVLAWYHPAHCGYISDVN